ncbi:MAG: CTP synthetase [Halobacteriaceae archaeon]
MNVVVTGPDDAGVADALAAHGATVTRVTDAATQDRLREAGIDEAALLVVTDVGDATAIPVAKDRNPDIRAVLYTDDAVPPFVRGQLDLAIDPALLDAGTVAAELLDDHD